MLTFFGTIIIVYFLWLVVKPMLARYMQRKFQQKVNDMFGQMFGQAPGQSDTTHDNEAYSRRQDAHGRYRQRKSKIFSRDEGEYVEFEEVRATSSSETSATSDCSSSFGRHTPREPQVSDAEWEDIR
ncbi:DUF4834 family protein [Duncaniella freteri]|uniref:DUF4834 family protein n=1 Tax=Duncaniella freteri TaxID=2530391 RepID=UPI00136BA461|nr:DUF4834 family protein [Duncaniella freteri]NBJ06835.1 DUF4834 family protein [Alistipes sp. Z76]NCE68939.1 DUF4834 family protein [Muribaculaceae bacterium M3]